MKWLEIKIIFSSDNPSLAVDLVADVFYGLDSKGVVIDDPLLEPEENWAPDAVARPDRPAVTGYMPVDQKIEERRHTIEQSISRLTGEHVLDPSIKIRFISEEDWAESWKKFFKPQKITSHIVVKPTWHDYKTEQDQLVIDIDPGMAFGTGTHPSTCMCLHLLERYVRPGNAVLDVGTGSGILLVAAAKLGASRLAGVDSDEMAVDIARKNLIQNNVDLSSIQLQCGDLVKNVSNTYDVVVANILAEVVIALLDDVAAVIKPGGRFICSGIIQAFETGVTDKMEFNGFDIVDRMQDGDWVALVGKQHQRVA